jgi:hypothetical protein
LVFRTSVPEHPTDRTKEDQQTDRRIVANRRSSASANHEANSEARAMNATMNSSASSLPFVPFFLAMAHTETTISANILVECRFANFPF